MLNEARLHNHPMSNPGEMTPDMLPAVAAFVRVARHSSFTRAAAELNVSPSALSQTVRALEERLGTRLLNRTTRKVGLTELGALFLQHADAGLMQIGSAFSQLEDLHDEPVGSVRLNLPRVANEMLVAPRLAEFVARHPKIRLDLALDDSFADLIGGGWDAGIRLGESLAQDMVATRISGDMRQGVFASPAYLARRGVPQRPEDVPAHDCIDARFASGSIYRWEFVSGRGRSKRVFEIETSARFVSNDLGTLLAAARQGLGLVSMMEATVRDDIAAGTLVPVLEAWWPTFPGFHVYYPNRAHQPRKLRALVDFLREGAAA